MTREEAQEYAKTMTYTDAIYNLMQAKFIPYRKATFIKITELLKALEQEPCDKCIYSTPRGECQYDDIAETIPTEQEPKTGHLSNKDWIDLLTEQFNVSRTSAKEMLHAMMSVKKEDNFKKQFSGGQNVFNNSKR